MVRMVSTRFFQSQFGVCPSPGAAYVVGGGDGVFAVNQDIIVRFHTRIPKGSVITNATLSFNVVVKNTNTTQSSFHEVRGENVGDSALLVAGVAENYRPKTGTMVSWTCSWVAPPPAGDVISTINVKPILDEIMARPDYVPGAYVTFFIKCTNENGSDMSVRLNNIFAPSPTLTVDFTPPVTDERITFNRCENSEFHPSLDSPTETNPAAGNNVAAWVQGAYYGAFVDPAVNGGVMNVDNAFTRLPGIPTLRFTCGTPPAEPMPFTGPYIGCPDVQPGESFVFAGWIFLPNTIPTSAEIWAGDVYVSFYNISGLPRGVWRPFSSPVVTNTGTTPITRWPAVGLKPFTAGMQFWISEPSCLITPVREMPFNGLTPDKDGIDNRSSKSRQASTRVWTPRRSMLVNGVPTKVPTWKRRSDVSSPIMELSEPTKGGPQIQQLPAGITIGELPAGQTVTEL